MNKLISQFTVTSQWNFILKLETNLSVNNGDFSNTQNYCTSVCFLYAFYSSKVMNPLYDIFHS